jgi:hypothetical protein
MGGGCGEEGGGGGGSSGAIDNDDDDASSKFIRRPTTGIMTAHPVHAKPSKLIQVISSEKIKSLSSFSFFSNYFFPLTMDCAALMDEGSFFVLFLLNPKRKIEHF